MDVLELCTTDSVLIKSSIFRHVVVVVVVGVGVINLF